VIVAIDDFGTGYSSLSYLKELESDKIKIDRMFIKDYPDSDDGKILVSIINMIKNVSKTIIVEGVETPEQLEFIKEHGCEEFQGFLFHKPMSIDALGKIIRSLR
jgi:EAL domain-containing protein (putative c-di-GMP-specific phosphodiesterase class I)